MHDRGLKRLGAVAYVALLVGALIYFQNTTLDLADQSASVIGALVALLGVPPVLRSLWRMWRGEGAAEGSNPVLEEAAGQLAVAVRNQWDAEAALRRVHDPYPLSVSWQAVNEDLAIPWSELVELACAWPGGPPGDPARWPRDTAGLNGQDGAIGEVFTDRIPTRRLVILGEPGSGKSVLLIRLLQDLLARRTEDEPVPVLFSLASWDPHQPLKGWLADQLRRHYPGLRATVMTSTSGTASDLAEALLESGRILPLLDGFDELPEHLHPLALDALNRALLAGRALVLAARSAAYRAAVSGLGPTLRLNGAAAVQLLPLNPERAAAYLRRDAGGPHTFGATRWDAVVGQLGTDNPVGQALSTPLGLFLARTIYNPRPGTDGNDAAPHPDELCDRQILPDRTAVDQHLFRSFIPAAYAPDGPQPPRWNAAQAQHVFTFLARFQETRGHGSPDLAWWELPRAVPAGLQCLMGGLVFSLVWVLAGTVGGFYTVEVLSVVAGGVGGAAIGRRTYQRPIITFLFGMSGVAVSGLAVLLVLSPVEHALPSTYPPNGFLTGMTLGCLIFHLSRRSAAPSGGRQQLREGLASGLWGLTVIVAAAVGWILTSGNLPVVILGALASVGVMYRTRCRLTPRTPDVTSSTGASRLFASDRRAFLLVGIIFAPVAGAVFGLVFTTWIGDALGLGFSGTADEFGLRSRIALGIATGAATALVLGMASAAWPHFVIARTYLAMRRHVPRELMTFLQDAHEHRGVLRQVGPVYQFRHIDLQRHLAHNAEG
ncbi:NACHT domain-containing protein [Streptomyces sp. NPDC012825]|uniref:NACHT domain-containing protein n=1 Tax=Streptomyces sp. NPDC012825 TaxID=3364851 RepID=UPI0036AE1AAD